MPEGTPRAHAVVRISLWVLRHEGAQWKDKWVTAGESMGRISHLLSKLPAQLEEIKKQYERDVLQKEMSLDLLHEIARLVEDLQRVLDWTATDLDQTFGTGRDRSPYFPLVTTSAKFETVLARDFPSLPVVVLNELERSQPYNPGRNELRYLHDLTRVNKHQDFTEQTRTETRRVRASSMGGGAVEWTPFQQGHGGVIFGGAPGSVLINGVPIDPVTQRPVPSPSQIVTETILVGWNFVTPSVPVIETLDNIVRQVIDVVA
jgi:hypothetical protein